ncbi:MAG: hypothetical protein F4Z77_12500 [Dehalococcoidia bacterium]|nr:hypothetical protein [Dehalococcoidia bacterium]MXZ54090.1 hypothetical protein [Acidimicrobiaceae bacterium]MYB87223.1 hypothetical protein [Acidimicrobiaceae bacterium]MYH93356.1 hypothetical protein [Acidimicrobiaceae bacterium]
MTKEPDNLSDFRSAYLDYLEGERPVAPLIDDLTGEERLAAEAFVESITTARGIDPYASRPSIEELHAILTRTSDGVDELGEMLQAHLRHGVDQTAVVVVDVAADAAGLASALVVHAHGMRLRVVAEPPSVDLDAAFATRVGDIAAVFGAFPDSSVVLYATTGADAVGVIVEREDVHNAIETPSGAVVAARLRRPVMDAASACAMWLQEAVPEFEPLQIDLLGSPATPDALPDPLSLATRAVDELVVAGNRARIGAKRVAWGTLGETESQGLAAIVDDAQHGRLSSDEYRRRLEDTVEMAA